MVWLVAAGSAIFILGLMVKIRTLQKQKDRAEASAHGAQGLINTRHFEYNELISEVSVLLREKIQQLKIKQEFEVARAIQETLLPECTHRVYGNLSVYGKVRMQSGCGGDWWYHSCTNDQVTLWIGDVTGHGVPSALVASACRAAVGALAELGIENAEVAMTKLNKILVPMTKGSMAVSAICVSINRITGVATVVNASHPHTVYVTKEGKASLLTEVLNPLIGVDKDVQYLGVDLKLNEKEMLILLTDGVLDFPRARKPMWSLRRLLNFLSEVAVKDIELRSVVAELEHKLQQHEKPEDDVTYVAVQRDSAA